MKKTYATRFHHFIICAFAMLSTSFASAAPQLNGISTYSELGQEQFIAAVYTDKVTNSARELVLSDYEKAMEVRVLKPIFTRKFNRMWVEGIAINSGSQEMESQAQNLADFSNMMRIKLRPGDILRMERVPQKSTKIFINGIQLGIIKDPTFFDLLLRTWVGPVPLSSDFKNELLAAGKVPDEQFQKFRTVRPSDERVAAITAALIPSEEEIDTPERSSSSVAQTVASASQPSSQAPQVAQASSSSSKASATEVVAQSSIAKPAETVTGIVTEDDLFSDDSIFDEEDGDFTFTAESLLSEQLYISKLTKWTGNYVKYPKFALRNEQQGTVRLTVTLARDGKVLDVQFMEKSRYEQLNRAAERAVTSASPYPAVPDEIKGDTFIFTVPVVFRLQ